MVTKTGFASRFERRIYFQLAVIVGTLASMPPSELQAAPPEAAQQREKTSSISGIHNDAIRFEPIAELLSSTYKSEDVKPVQHLEPLLSQPAGVGMESVETLPPGVVAPNEQAFPIDLPTALALAGANNLQIAIAAERVNQAAARLTGARALWIPNLNGGVVYYNHAGRIQETEGRVIEASRSALFTGGAAGIGNSPAAGGSGGPARMFVDLSLVDALFEPLSARQIVRATAADRTSTFNDTLLQVAVGYLALARAQARVAIAEEAVQNANELVRITRNFAETGQGLQADADRAVIEAASRQRDVWQAREDVAVISAELARLLRLDPAVRLQAADNNPAPLEFVETSMPLQPLIAQAVAVRPEMASADAQRDAAALRRRQEQLRPWVPNLYAGVSGGGFGGSEGSEIDNFGGRADFDVALLWQVENLGFGNSARQREQQSLTRQATLALQQIREIIEAEVAQAYQRIQMRDRQIEVTRPPVESAYQAVRLNMEGIQAGELRPIEIQQAIGALAAARTQYLDAVIDYNAAQLQMVRAIGRPPEMLPRAHQE
ncbi:MAG: TolC family protein [Pirellulales bacterium]